MTDASSGRDDVDITGVARCPRCGGETWHDAEDGSTVHLGTGGVCLVYTTVVEAEQVTDEILTMAEEIADGRYADGPVDRDDLIDRLERSGYLDDGTMLDLGGDADSPAIRKIKRHVREYQRET